MRLKDSVSWQIGQRPPSEGALFLRLLAPRAGDSFNVLPHDEHLRDLRLKVILISFPELVRAQVYPFEGETGWDPQHTHPHGIVTIRKVAKHTRRARKVLSEASNLDTAFFPRLFTWFWKRASNSCAAPRQSRFSRGKADGQDGTLLVAHART